MSFYYIKIDHILSVTVSISHKNGDEIKCVHPSGAGSQMLFFYCFTLVNIISFYRNWLEFIVYFNEQ